MSRRDDLIFIGDMIDHAEFALDFVRGRVASDIRTDRKMAFAVVRALEVVGEAATRVSAECRERHPEVPWRQVIGMRNVLIHGYTRIDYELVWEIAVDWLPPLIEQLRAIVEEGQHE